MKREKAGRERYRRKIRESALGWKTVGGESEVETRGKRRKEECSFRDREGRKGDEAEVVYLLRRKKRSERVLNRMGKKGEQRSCSREPSSRFD